MEPAARPGSWIAIGTVAAPPVAFVDEVGTVHDTARRLATSWAVHTPDGWVVPGVSHVTRTTSAGAAVVESALKVPSGQVVHRAYAVGVDGRSLVVIDIENASAIPVAVALRIVPSPLLEVSPVSAAGHVTADGGVVRYNGLPYLYVDRRLADDALASGPSGQPPDGYAVVVPVTHRATARLLVVGSETEPVRSPLPGLDQVRSGWAKHLATGARVASADGAVDALWESALVSLLVAADIEHVPRPLGVTGDDWTFVDEARVAGALGAAGFTAEGGLVLGSLMEHLQVGPLGGSVGQEAVVLGALGQWFRASGDPSLVTTFPAELLGAADRILRAMSPRRRRFLRRGAPDDALAQGPGRRAVIDLASMLRSIGEREASDILLGRLPALPALDASAPDDPGPDPVAAVERFDRIRRRNGRFPTTVDAGGRAIAGAGDDPRRAADVVDAVRAVLVDDAEAAAGATTVAVVPVLLPRWRGSSFEVHGLPTAVGSLSFGVRWHGPRPALLWEIEPHEGVSGADLMLTSPGLDPTWIGAGASGDALLAPGAPPP